MILLGFGILFIGYFLTLNLNLKGVNVPPDFLGYLIMFAACNKLRDYSPYFKKTNWALIPLAAISGGLFTFEIFTLFGASSFALTPVLEFVKTLISGVMHFFLLKALMEISRDVGRTKITGKCQRNIFITLAIISIQALLSIPFIELPFLELPVKSELYRHFTDIGVNFMVILNSIQIFSCYMWICYEGDEDMDVENSNDPLAKLTAKMAKENAEYRSEKKKNKNNKSSKKKK